MTLWPLAVYFALVLLLVGSMIGASFVLGERHREPATDQPYEGGLVSAGSARVRLSAKFYLIAVFFVLFDLEAVFVYAWAVAAREVGWPGYIELSVFLGVLAVALAWMWRIGALDWTVVRRRIR